MSDNGTTPDPYYTTALSLSLSIPVSLSLSLSLFNLFTQYFSLYKSLLISHVLSILQRARVFLGFPNTPYPLYPIAILFSCSFLPQRSTYCAGLFGTVYPGFQF
ncbi:hypothetical protein L2E82_27404 [Cichorium intybus]|uniref:Uncharacterized protein n=1 Tax=Cichorium intybus TaxID=13427 RepID=A0ACB9CT99_CICIN|nr:hypothetical protein L2E82_27404 [Cichorium intybus]